MILIGQGVVGNDRIPRTRKRRTRMPLRAVKRGAGPVLLNAVGQVVINEIVRDGVTIPMQVHPVCLIADGRAD